VTDIITVFHKHAKGAAVTGPTGDTNNLTGGIGVVGVVSGTDGLVTEVRLAAIEARAAVRAHPSEWSFDPQKFAQAIS
jgi:hypothetical protein